MATGIFNGFLADDATISVNASGTALTVTKGDWVAWSGIWAVAANSGVGTYKVSGAGVALENNPIYDELGVPRVNTSLTVLRRGIIRASSTTSLGDGSDFLLGAPVFPTTTGSGIVGQTGATGISTVWTTAGFRQISGNPTGAVASGVGTLINIAQAGTTAQIDIQIAPQRPDYY